MKSESGLALELYKIHNSLEINRDGESNYNSSFFFFFPFGHDYLFSHVFKHMHWSDKLRFR